MGTTDVSLGLALLDSLDRLGVDYAVLHNVDALLAGSKTSDIDLVVDRDPWEVIARLAENRDSHGLWLTMPWAYDHGSLTSFWLSQSCDDGVQLDLLADRKGRGRIGLLTEAALADKVQGREEPPHLSAVTEAVYTLSKRILKRDRVRALAAIDKLIALDETNVEAEVRRLLSPRMRRRALRALRTGKVSMRGAGWDRWRARLSLLGLSRVATATGAVVSVADDRTRVQRIADRLSLVFPRVEIVASAPSRGREWWLTRGPRLVIVAIDGQGSHLMLGDSALSIVEELHARAKREIERHVQKTKGGSQ